MRVLAHLVRHPLDNLDTCRLEAFDLFWIVRQQPDGLETKVCQSADESFAAGKL